MGFFCLYLYIYLLLSEVQNHFKWYGLYLLWWKIQFINIACSMEIFHENDLLFDKIQEKLLLGNWSNVLFYGHCLCQRNLYSLWQLRHMFSFIYFCYCLIHWFHLSNNIVHSTFGNNEIGTRWFHSRIVAKMNQQKMPDSNKRKIYYIQNT